MVLIQMIHELVVGAAHQVAALLPPEFAPTPAPGGPPKPGDVQLPSGASAKLSTLLGWGKALVYVACTAGFFVAAGKMAVAHQRGDDAPWGRLAAVAGACIIGGGATGLVDALF